MNKSETNNELLKDLYNQMHKEGSSSWFGQSEEERELILKMGEPWSHIGQIILEIGCGEGDLGKMIWDRAGGYAGIDYSEVVIKKARDKYPTIPFWVSNYRDIDRKFTRLVMQGVLEHLDDPFTELKWMMDNLLTEKGDVITSSPCFLNSRGIVWMTLDMLGAVMSKTDLHFLNQWDFIEFAKQNGYEIKIRYCDKSWGNGTQMIEDFTKRLPLALKDGNIPYDEEKFQKFIAWLEKTSSWLYRTAINHFGATAVYKISK